MAVLNEKNVPYDIEYIDLNNKPDWFLKMSPTGKVPVIQTPDEEILFESAVINEFLDESHTPHFMPDTPLERAQQRMWIEFTSGLFGDVYRLFTASDEKTAHKELASAQAKLDRMAAEVQGPLFSGETFGLVDAAIAPAFTRLDWIDQLAPELNVFSNPVIASWKDALLARESVQNSILPNLFDIFKDGLKSRDTWFGQVA